MLGLIIHRVYKMFYWFAGDGFRCSSVLCLLIILLGKSSSLDSNSPQIKPYVIWKYYQSWKHLLTEKNSFQCLVNQIILMRLVLFLQVTVIGDGSHKAEDISMHYLNDYSSLLTSGQRQHPLGYIQDSCDRLIASLEK